MVPVPPPKLIRVGCAKAEPDLEFAVGFVGPALGEERFDE
jgi:hypothetical protein